jgi:hypothetical protein
MISSALTIALSYFADTGGKIRVQILYKRSEIPANNVILAIAVSAT